MNVVKKSIQDFNKLKYMEELASEKYEEDSFVSKLSSEKSNGGFEGIRLRTASKQPYFREQRPGAWMPKRINLSGWFAWFSSTMKRFSHNLWGKEIDEISEQVKLYENKMNELSKELTETKIKLDEAEQKLNKQQNELELAKEVIDKLSIYETALTDFKTEVKRLASEDRRDEASVKTKINESRWLLGLDCEIKASEQKADTQLAIDLHIRTDMGEDKIYEFKSPNLKPFYRKTKDGRLYISDILAEGLNQLILYMRRTNIYSKSNEEGTYKIQAPSGMIVIGFDLDEEQEKLRKEWNFHLRPHIRIITYNDIIETAERQLENIRYARKIKEKEKKDVV